MPAALAEDEIRRFLEAHERQVAPLYKAYCQRFWELSLSGSDEDARVLIEAKKEFLKVYANREQFMRLEGWFRALSDGQRTEMDPLMARQIKLIHASFVPHQMDESIQRDIVERETHIENLFNTFRADFEGAKASDNELLEILRHERNVVRRREAWEATKQIGVAVAGPLLELIEIRNREARRLGYRDYYAMMMELQELDENWLFDLIEELDRVSETPYVALKRHLDVDLKNRYGITEPECYPWLYGDPFLQELPALSIQDQLDEIFRDRDIASVTRAHYAGIGLDIEDLLDRSDLYERHGKSQHAFCLDVDHEGDVRVLSNILPNERWMSTMLHEFGHAVYDKYNDRSLPFLLRTPAHTLTTEAIAMLNGRMTKTPNWLTAMAGVSEARAAPIGAQALAGMRAEMLIFLRWAITLVCFERELYKDPGQPLSSLWWTLVERHQKITPPGRDAPDWASKNHLATAPVYYQNYILGELVASQILDYIRRFVRSDSTVVHRDVGRYWVDRIFRAGARYEWNDMLEQATEERLNPDHFIRQFVVG